MGETTSITKNLSILWSESFLRETTDFIFLKDTELRYILVSQAFVEMTGKTIDEIIGKTDFDIFGDRELAKNYVNDDKWMIENGKDLPAFVELITSKDNHERFSSTSKYLLRDEQNNIIGVYGVGRDITNTIALQKNNQEIKRNMDLQSKLSPNTCVTVLFDVDNWSVETINCRKESMQDTFFCHTINDFIKAARESVIDNPEAEEFFATITQGKILTDFEQGKARYSLEYLKHFVNGEELWVREEFISLLDPDTKHVMMFVGINDIDADKRIVEDLTKAAQTDRLSNLLNHSSTLEQMAIYLQRDGINGLHAVFMLDIDNFKSVNDLLGHQYGDKVIEEVSSVIRSCFRKSDIIGRVGGDEFLILMKNCSNMEMIRKKAEELVMKLQFSLKANRRVVDMTTSIGVSIYHSKEQTIDELFASADAALYTSKGKGKNCYWISKEDIKLTERFDETYFNQPVQYQKLLENIEAGVMVFDLTNGILPVYVSPSTYKMMGKKQSELTEVTRKDVGIVEEDLGLIRKELRELAIDGLTRDFSYRVFFNGQLDAVKYQRAKVVKLDTADNTCKALAVITDITDYENAKKDLEREHFKLKVALEKSKTYVWELDIINKKAALQNYGIVGRNEEVVENLPESNINDNKIAQESIEDYRALYQEVYNGSPEVSKEIHYMKFAGEERYMRCTFNTIFDENNKPVSAIGIAKDITFERKTHENYRKVFNARAVLDVNAAGSFAMNITRNFFYDAKMINEDHQKIAKETTIDDFFKYIYQNVPDEFKREEYLRKFNRQSLYESFVAGNSCVVDEGIFPAVSGKNEWIRTSVYMANNPETGELEGMVYAVNINDQKLLKAMVDRIVEINYEYFCLLDYNTGILSNVHMQNEGVVCCPQENSVYDKVYGESVCQLVKEDYVAECLEKMKISNINQQLQDKKVFSLTYPTNSSSGKDEYKRWQYFWLDKSKNLIGFSRSEVSEEFED